MIIKLHKQARTTPAVRAEIQAAPATISNTVLAERYGVTLPTITKWRNRQSVEDRSHTAHHLRTTLTTPQELIAIELRKMLKLTLDDLLVVVREFLNPDVSRAGLARCLKRYGVNRLRELEPVPVTTPNTSKPFKDYEPGFVHVDIKYLPQMPDETQRRYLFVAIDRATRWVYVQIKPHKTAAAARAFLAGLSKAAPFKINILLTDNGSEFTDRLFNKQKQARGEHQFDQLCTALNIDHRLTKPKHPQTNGMVERFNGRIADVLATHRFQSGEDLALTLDRYVFLYNQHLPQQALKHKTPIQALKEWQQNKPELFNKRVINRAGLDTVSVTLIIKNNILTRQNRSLAVRIAPLLGDLARLDSAASPEKQRPRQKSGP